MDLCFEKKIIFKIINKNYTNFNVTCVRGFFGL